jgi:hypothetical protein
MENRLITANGMYDLKINNATNVIVSVRRINGEEYPVVRTNPIYFTSHFLKLDSVGQRSSTGTWQCDKQTVTAYKVDAAGIQQRPATDFELNKIAAEVCQGIAHYETQFADKFRDGELRYYNRLIGDQCNKIEDMKASLKALEKTRDKLIAERDAI